MRDSCNCSNLKSIDRIFFYEMFFFSFFLLQLGYQGATKKAKLSPQLSLDMIFSFLILKSESSVQGKLSATFIILHFFPSAASNAGWATKPTCSPGTWDEMIVTLVRAARECWSPGYFDLGRIYKNLWIPLLTFIFYHGLCKKEGHGQSAANLSFCV